MRAYFKGFVPKGFKHCYKCKEVKPLTEFYLDRGRYDGVKGMCKSCCIEYNRGYSKRPRVRAKWNERTRIRMYEHYHKLRLKALQKISHLEKPCCIVCGCDVIDMLEINHLNGGGNKEYKKYHHKCLPFYRDIISGKRATGDLDVRCLVCNRAYYAQLKFGVKYSITFLRKMNNLINAPFQQS